MSEQRHENFIQLSMPTDPNKKPGEKSTNVIKESELNSDGSASAFEGTEAVSDEKTSNQNTDQEGKQDPFKDAGFHDY